MDRVQLTKILEDNEENINRSDWNAVYESISPEWLRGEFSDFLIENDIDPGKMFKTEIPKMAFQRCKSLTSIVISNDVTSIEEIAFRWCESVKSVTIPNSVTKIGSEAFVDCKALAEVKYDGTAKDWCKIQLGDGWLRRCPAKIVFLR